MPRALICKLSQQLLTTHVARRAGNRSTRVGAGAAKVNTVQVTEAIEVRRRIIRVRPIKKCLAIDQHRMVRIAAREMKQLLQVARCKQARPYAVFRVLDLCQNHLLNLIFDRR